MSLASRISRLEEGLAPPRKLVLVVHDPTDPPTPEEEEILKRDDARRLEEEDFFCSVWSGERARSLGAPPRPGATKGPAFKLHVELPGGKGEITVG
jgi:hypothetical protein